MMSRTLNPACDTDNSAPCIAVLDQPCEASRQDRRKRLALTARKFSVRVQRNPWAGTALPPTEAFAANSVGPVFVWRLVALGLEQGLPRNGGNLQLTSISPFELQPTRSSSHGLTSVGVQRPDTQVCWRDGLQASRDSCLCRRS